MGRRRGRAHCRPRWLCFVKFSAPSGAASAGWAQLPDFTRTMMYLDLISYLPDDILLKVDRAAMGSVSSAVCHSSITGPSSLSARSVVDEDPKRPGQVALAPGAVPLRPRAPDRATEDRIWSPHRCVVRGPLRDWAESLLDEGRLRREGFFDPTLVRQKWEEHVSRGWRMPGLNEATTWRC
jgi:asparagine synthase (glutamine-hydrolysing)